MANGNPEKPVVFLRGKRVILRPVMEQDIPLFIRWTNDPEVRRYTRIEFPVNDTKEREWYEHMHKSATDAYLAIDVDGIPIGIMGLHRINMVSRTAATGAFIGEAEYRNKGYGTEAKMLMLHYAFHALNLRKICSSVIAFNKRSLRYQEKTGYKVEGVRRQQLYRNGRYYDEILTAVFREDWEPLWRQFRKTYRLPCCR